jgi:hypothetical protein
MSLRTWNEILTASAGTIVINDTTAYTAKPVYAVYVVEDTVFNVLTDGAGNDKADYITTPATAVKAGVLITPFDKQKPFVNIDLTSGSVVAIL